LNTVIVAHYAKVKGLTELFEGTQQGKEPILLRFARGILQGKYDDNKVFLGLIHAMVQKNDRDERGVGTQNFQYTPAYDEFLHIISIHSPRAYKFISTHFQARARDGFRQRESRQPKLPLTICAETFTLVKKRLDHWSCWC
jgi:hypothetical protein